MQSIRKSAEVAMSIMSIEACSSIPFPRSCKDLRVIPHALLKVKFQPKLCGAG